MAASALATLLLLALTGLPLAAAEPLVLNLWPGTPPGDTGTLPPEADLTKDTDKLIAGRRIIKLGNVTTPQLAVYRPAKEKDTGAAVIICPGGGFSIHGAPDLVIEVLSPATAQLDKTTKRRVYARTGVQEMWLVDPLLLQIHLYDFARDPKKAVRILEDDETFETALLPGLTVAAAEVFKR